MTSKHVVVVLSFVRLDMTKSNQNSRIGGKWQNDFVV